MIENMDLSSVPIQNPAVLGQKIIADEMVLMNADTAASLALTNQTALIVWDLVDGNRSIQNIIDEVKTYFQDIPDTVADDVINLLELLSQDGFIGYEYNPEKQNI